MKISLHAGLHKSGTTSIQAGFFGAFSTPTAIWYPDLGCPYHTHNNLAHEFTSAIRTAEPNTKRVNYRRYLQLPAMSFSEVIAEATARDVEHLLISAELFDDITPTQCTELAGVLAGHDVTVLLTATRPSHRWYSLWQELVKHGLAERPLDSTEKIVCQCALRPARLGELITTLPGTRKVVRLVRTDPIDFELPRSVGALLGLELPAANGLPPANVSIGASTELLRAMNERNLTQGVMTRESITRFVEYREAHPAITGTSPHADRYGTPPELATTATAELAFLKTAAADGTIELFDPDNELARWTDMTPPAWVLEAINSDWPPPGDPVATDSDGAWEARIELASWINRKNKQISELEATCSGLQEELSERMAREERIAEELIVALNQNRDLNAQNRDLNAQNHDLNAQNHDLNAQNRDLNAQNRDLIGQNRDLYVQTTSLNAAIRSIQQSRSWRLLSPLRRLRKRIVRRR